MRYSLAALARRTGKTRRKEIVLRTPPAPAMLASDLYAAAYAPMVRLWNEALPGLLAQYEASLAAMTRDSPADLGALLGSVESEAARVILTVRLRLEHWALRLEKWQRTKWRGAVLSATGVDLDTVIGPADARITVATAVERNVGLIRSIGEQARTRIGEAIFAGLNQRKPAREVAAELREAVGMSRKRALNVASDQTVKLAAQLQSERARDAGLEFYEWVHSGKLHPREEHRARNGQRFKYGEPSGDEPGMAIYCGCTARAVLSLDGEF